MFFYLPHALLKVLRRLTQLVASKIIIKQPSDVRDEGFMWVYVAPLLHQPLCGVAAVAANPASKTTMLQSVCDFMLSRAC